MALKIEKAAGTGFCSGVKRAINILQEFALEHGMVETLGPVVHNRQVLQRLAGIGVRVADSIDDIQGDTVAIGSHGVSPGIEEELQARHLKILNTTCPFVRRAQAAARRLAESGFYVIIYGDSNHPEVKGILGWARGNGVAIKDDSSITSLSQQELPRRLGILSQTTQVPAHFTGFVKNLIDYVLVKDSELRIIDTICHDIRTRQAAAIELASKVDLMFVIGGRNSANTNHLVELCSTATRTHWIETADDIQPLWLQGHSHIGVTSGASTASESVDEVLQKLKSMG